MHHQFSVSQATGGKTAGPATRSTSIKPNQTTAEGATSATKASYMQATSSWAKKKGQILRDKEALHEKKAE